MATNTRLCFVCQKRAKDASDKLRCKQCAGEVVEERTALGNLRELVDRLSASVHKSLVNFGYPVELDYVVTRVDENLAYGTAQPGDIISMMSRSIMEQAGVPLGSATRPERTGE